MYICITSYHDIKIKNPREEWLLMTAYTLQVVKNSNFTPLDSFYLIFSYIRVFVYKCLVNGSTFLTLLHPERPKLYTVLAFLSAIRLN